MFSTYFTKLNKDAFIRPEKKTSTIPADYKSLYGDEEVIREYSKENKESSEKFQNQFSHLLDSLKKWGENNECNAPALLKNIDHCKTKFFEASYSKNQPTDFFNIIKLNLENLWFILSLNQNIPPLKKQTLFKQLISTFNACAPGLYTHIEDALNAFISEVSLEQCLAELRTNLIRKLADRHNHEHKIAEGNTIHSYNAFLIYGQNEGWAPLSDVNKTIDPFASAHTLVDEKTLTQLNKDFEELYSPQAIVECVKTNFSLELNKLKNTLNIKENKEGWIPSSPEFIKKTTELSKAFGLKEEDVLFFDLSDDSLLMRFNLEMFNSIFLRHCQREEKLLNKSFWQTISLENGSQIHYFNSYLSWHENSDKQVTNFLQNNVSNELFARVDLLSELKKTLDKLPESIWFVFLNSSRSICTRSDLIYFLSQYTDMSMLRKVLKVLDIERFMQFIKTGESLIWFLDTLKNSPETGAEVLATFGKEFVAKLIKQGDTTSVKSIINARTSNYSISKILIQHIDFFKKDAGGKSLAILAVEMRNRDMINIIFNTVRKMSGPESEEKAAPPAIAVRMNDVDLIKALINSKISFQCSDVHDDYPVHIAAKQNRIDVIRSLHENKVDINSIGWQGNTPLHIAAAEGHIDMIKILCAFKANIDSQTIHGRTPLHCAIDVVKTNSIRALVELKADLNLKIVYDEELHTPISLALKNIFGGFANEKVIQVFAELKTDFITEKSGHDGSSALRNALDYFFASEKKYTFLKILVMMLMSITSEQDKKIEQKDKASLIKLRNDLTETFIKMTKEMKEPEQKRNIQNLFTSDNALSTLLSSDNKFHLFKPKYSEYMQKIVTELKYVPEPKRKTTHHIIHQVLERSYPDYSFEPLPPVAPVAAVAPVALAERKR